MTAHPSLQKYTVWGLDPIQLHARFWASRGVQIVRPGELTEIVPHAELFLLLDPRMLTVFRLAAILDTLSWLEPELTTVRVRDAAREGYREHVVTNASGRFVRFKRVYHGSDPRMARVGLTSDRELARLWQGTLDAKAGWAQLRRYVRKSARYTATLKGRVFDATHPEEIAGFTRELLQQWTRPDATVSRVRQVGDRIWADDSAKVAPGPGIRGPLWIGAGRDLAAGATAIGPSVMWDAPGQRPEDKGIKWLELEPLSQPIPQIARRKLAPSRGIKRAFDIAFSLVALFFTLPLYPILAAAIVIEDGFPVFFRHRRETMGGQEFGCLKFRSMRNDAEKMKAQLVGKNQADGPQFFMKDDPRNTRVGKLLRDLQLDELPQFINVLRGDMSVVGPRPSPFKENQYCPPWREARLSVRPGLTGLWQISRTRAEGTDFQEWIKFDIEYVERQSFFFDLWIIWRTVAMLVRRLTRS